MNHLAFDLGTYKTVQACVVNNKLQLKNDPLGFRETYSLIHPRQTTQFGHALTPAHHSVQVLSSQPFQHPKLQTPLGKSQKIAYFLKHLLAQEKTFNFAITFAQSCSFSERMQIFRGGVLCDQERFKGVVSQSVACCLDFLYINSMKVDKKKIGILIFSERQLSFSSFLIGNQQITQLIPTLSFQGLRALKVELLQSKGKSVSPKTLEHASKVIESLSLGEQAEWQSLSATRTQLVSLPFCEKVGEFFESLKTNKWLDQLDEILPFGCGTRMPLFKSCLTSIAERVTINNALNKSQSAARGAALWTLRTNPLSKLHLIKIKLILQEDIELSYSSKRITTKFVPFQRGCHYPARRQLRLDPFEIADIHNQTQQFRFNARGTSSGAVIVLLLNEQGLLQCSVWSQPAIDGKVLQKMSIQQRKFLSTRKEVKVAEWESESKALLEAVKADRSG